MSEVKKLSKASQRDGVEYRTASTMSLILGVATNGGGMCFYLLMMYASYIANAGYGIAVALAGMIITGTRIFDGVTDPLVALIFDRWKAGKHGKIRIFLFLAWAVMSLACLMMYQWMTGKYTGAAGIAWFIGLYVIYIIGYTMMNMSSGAIGNIITNDPTQRPFMNLIGTIYSYTVPMAMNTIISFAILPKYDNQYNAPMLQEACVWYITAAFIFMVLACIGLTPADKPEILNSVTFGDDGSKKIGFKEMWSLLKDNRNLQMYIITGASDKLAQTTAGQSIVTVMLNGILIANYQAATLMGNATAIVGIAFAFVGGVFVAKKGSKVATTVWSWAAIGVSIIMIVFCAILGPTGMVKIGKMGLPMIIYVVLSIALTGVKMILSTASGVMRADVTDYELERSGNFMVGTVGGIYSFLDKIISSFASTIAAFAVSFIGYKTVMPQMGDKVTTAVFWMTMFLSFGLPVIGWLCNVWAMKHYDLTKERMVEVQKNVSALKKGDESEE